MRTVIGLLCSVLKVDDFGVGRVVHVERRDRELAGLDRFERGFERPATGVAAGRGGMSLVRSLLRTSKSPSLFGKLRQLDARAARRVDFERQPNRLGDLGGVLGRRGRSACTGLGATESASGGGQARSSASDRM